MRYVLILVAIAIAGITYAQFYAPYADSRYYIDESDDPPVWNP